MQSLAVLVVFVPIAVLSHPMLGDPFSPLGRWHNRNSPCTLPHFVHKLPEEAQAKIRSIWSTYEEGKPCDQEHEETKKIVKALPQDVRRKIFSGLCGPSFLRNASETIRGEFKKVWFDMKMELADKEAAFRKLAYSLLTGELLALFNKWDEELQRRKQEHKEKLESLSPAAKAAYDEWKALRRQERNFLANLPKEVMEELKGLCPCPHCKKTIPMLPTASSTTTEATTTTSTSEAATTETAVISSSTEAPVEETTDAEFNIFLDATVLPNFVAPSECTEYY
ncbi:hypothetical protein L596_001845 [Steinernema carpocapsae]|uniref:SXP/RAL-2 family protein Ani s 5-like cation-binding domain-containing protein n=1 Tax=Steinernema carpocapsae TaxID=34508 RepID=A0A4U8URA3_STECR|nr:hypothetical protein L596_001845 [Steinernema carpocapsae]